MSRLTKEILDGLYSMLLAETGNTRPYFRPTITPMQVIQLKYGGWRKLVKRRINYLRKR